MAKRIRYGIEPMSLGNMRKSRGRAGAARAKHGRRERQRWQRSVNKVSDKRVP
jgi:hypothetical protein